MVNPRWSSETHSAGGPLDDRYRVSMEGKARMISRASKVSDQTMTAIDI